MVDIEVWPPILFFLTPIHAYGKDLVTWEETKRRWLVSNLDNIARWKQGLSAFHGPAAGEWLQRQDRLEFRHFQFPASAREGEEGSWCNGVHSKERGLKDGGGDGGEDFGDL